MKSQSVIRIWATVFVAVCGAPACSSDDSAPPSSAPPGADAAVEGGLDVSRPDSDLPDTRPDTALDAAEAAADAAPDVAPDADAGEAGTGPLDLGIISTTAGSTWESEAHIVVAPNGRTLAVWMSWGAAGLRNGYALSENRGETWSPATTMAGVNTFGDPVAATRSDNSFYYGYLEGVCTSGGCSQGHVWISRLPSGATEFEPAVDVSPADPPEFYDKPWLMTAADGSLVAIFAGRIGDYPNNVDQIIAARSVDGVTWTRSLVVPKQPQGQLVGIPHACTSRVGSRVWAIHVDLASPIFASIRWSDDFGATWPAANVSGNFAPVSEAQRIQAYDLRCAGEGDDVWVMYGLSSGSSGASSIPPLDEIRIVHSNDGGATWSPPGVIQMPGQKFLRPEIVVEPSGALDVIAYTGTDEGDLQGAVRRWRSTDSGASFVEQPMVHEPIRFLGSRAIDAWIGDYNGLTYDNGDLFVAYADNASGSAHIAFYRVPPE